MKKHVVLIAALVMTSTLSAKSGVHGNESHHQEAHVHGIAELTLARQGNTLEIRLASPAANIVGFEQQATTPEQVHLIDQALRILESPQQILFFTGTRCELKSAVVNMSGLASSGKSPAEHSDTNHGRTDHKRTDHEHTDHEERDASANHHEEYADSHSDITANYHFQCDDGAKLTSISVELFEQFPHIEKVKAMWVTASQQGAVDLSANTKIIRLGPTP